MSGNELPTVRAVVSPATTSGSSTSAARTQARSEHSPGKRELQAQSNAARERATRARRTIVNALELLLPAIDDLACADGLKACCEIMRRIGAKSAQLSVLNIRERTRQLSLLEEEDVA